MIDSRPLRLGLTVLLLALAAFNLLEHISVQAVYAFDEGRHAASAAEMVHTHDFLINHYNGQPDYYNAKPPLSMWGAALGYALPLNPLLGVRLFSLLAALATGIMVYLMGRRLAGWPAGLLAALVLVTVPISLLRHGARTADPDMLFVCFVTAAMLALASASRRWVALGYGLLGLAFLTKSFHVLPYGMVAVLFTALLCGRGQLRWRDLALLPWCFFVPVLPWAVARYLADGTQFFHVMVYYDLLARSTQVVEAHFTPPLFYVDSILAQLGPALLALAICLSNRSCRQLLRQPAGLLLLLWLLLPLALYSMAKSKLYWYVYPQLPPLALIIGVALISAIRGGLHRVPALVAVIVLGFNIAGNELSIYQTVTAYSLGDNAVEAALVQLANSSRPATVRVYLEPEANLNRMQDWLATAELMGNIDLRPGGRAAFDQDHDSGARLVTWDGHISGQP